MNKKLISTLFVLSIFCLLPIIFQQSCTETDRGDDPDNFGKVTCGSNVYKDSCSGIGKREELKEYFIKGDQVESKEYKLFKFGKYCKNGFIYKDVKNPTASLHSDSQNWINRDIAVYLICDDSDESGCWKYDYNVERIV